MTRRQSGEGAWPFPGDTRGIVRARRLLLVYRQALADNAPEACATIDALATRWGETWAVPGKMRHEPDDYVDTATAAELACVEPETVSTWRRRGRLNGEQVGARRWRYRVRDVLALSTDIRYRKGGGPG